MQKHRVLRVSERPWSVSRASPEHPRGQNTAFYDGFHGSAHKNIVFYAFLCVPRASSRRFQSIPELKTPYFTMVFTPRKAKTIFYVFRSVLRTFPRRPQSALRASSAVKILCFAMVFVSRRKTTLCFTCFRMFYRQTDRQTDRQSRPNHSESRRDRQ